MGIVVFMWIAGAAIGLAFIADAEDYHEWKRAERIRAAIDHDY